MNLHQMWQLPTQRQEDMTRHISHWVMEQMKISRAKLSGGKYAKRINKVTTKMLPRPSRKCVIPDFWPEKLFVNSRFRSCTIQQQPWSLAWQLLIQVWNVKGEANIPGQVKKKKTKTKVMQKPRASKTTEEHQALAPQEMEESTTNIKMFPLYRGVGGSTGSRSSSTNAMLHISSKLAKQSTDSRGCHLHFSCYHRPP